MKIIIGMFILFIVLFNMSIFIMSSRCEDIDIKEE